MPKETLSVTDDRNGKSYTLPIEKGAVRAMDLRQIKTSPEDFGLLSYDPAFMNTASCRSAVTFIDGDKGILRYRGYPIEELAERCTFLEVAYLLLQGELPNPEQLKQWVWEITHHTMLHENVKTFIDGDQGILRYRGYPIEELAEHCTFLEVAYLLLHGELPNPEQLKQWVWEITHHTMLHENLKKFMDGFHYDAHPMGMLVSTLAALSTQIGRASCRERV